MTQKYGIPFVVDASQTAGYFPSMCSEHIDFLVLYRAQKPAWPSGNRRALCQNRSAASTVKERRQRRADVQQKTSAADADALEAGTLNGHGIAGLDAALDYLKQTGMTTISEKEQHLMWQFYEGIRDISGVRFMVIFHRKTGVPLYL